MAKTSSEGLAGFIAYKTDTMPVVTSHEFDFVNVDVDEFERLQKEYVTAGFSQVQQFVVMCGQKRRSARSSYNSNKG